MKLADAIYKRILYFMNKKGLSSLWDLYKVCGVPKSTINALYGSKRSAIPRLTTLSQICNGLDTNLQEFFNDEMFKDIDDDM